jgi:RAT1-interacting protein
VWRIQRQRGSDHISLFRVEEAGHGNIITDEFMNWRIKLDLAKSKPPDSGPPSGSTPEAEPESSSGV